jgi:hypothetical protein
LFLHSKKDLKILPLKTIFVIHRSIRNEFELEPSLPSFSYTSMDDKDGFLFFKQFKKAQIMDTDISSFVG